MSPVSSQRLVNSLRVVSSAADDRSKFQTFFQKIFRNSKFHCRIWIQHEKCIKMSTNKLSIGAVVLEIAPLNFEKVMSNFNFLTPRISIVKSIKTIAKSSMAIQLALPVHVFLSDRLHRTNQCHSIKSSQVIIYRERV